MSTRFFFPYPQLRHIRRRHDARTALNSLHDPAKDAGYGAEAGSSSKPAGPDFDGVWKEALQKWLPECIALFWPAIHTLINWSVAPVFLHQELQRLHRVTKHGAKRTDLLVRVHLTAGEPALLLLHLEIKAGRLGKAFHKQMFHYRIILCAKYPDQPILSCAILLDRKTGPEMETFVQGGYGDTLTFEFPVANLAGWHDRVAELEALAPTNPFVAIVLAQLTCRATEPDASRMVSKLRLARSLKQWNYSQNVRDEVFRLIDSMLTLPPHLDQRFIEILEQSEDSDMVQQLSSIDRYLLRKEKNAGLEEGLQKGLQKGMAEGQVQAATNLLHTMLQRRFGPIPDWASTRIAQADVDTLQQWALNILDAQRLEDVFEP